MNRRARVTACLAAGLALALGGAPSLAQGAGDVRDARSTQRIFERFSPSVVQVRVVEAESGATSTRGSGFFTGDDGRVVTNFHVVSELVHRPGQYRLELVTAGGRLEPAELLGIDIAHDLAVLRTTGPVRAHLEVTDEALSKGRRVYALGNPFDLGMSIVEGTYNGLLEYSRSRRIHFTGGLNPGMSGGPAILADGTVAGVNVATAGNTVSFLVPAEYVTELLRRTAGADFAPARDFVMRAGEQLMALQEAAVEEILREPPKTIQLGGYRVPTANLSFFNCGGDTKHTKDERYLWRHHWCNTDDSVYFRDGHAFELLRFRHRQLESDDLGTAPFYALYSSFFETSYASLSGKTTDFTEFRCETGFVESENLTFKTVFCLRRYKQIPGLYDVVFKAAALGQEHSGLETALRLSAVSFDNAKALAARHLGAISWSE